MAGADTREARAEDPRALTPDDIMSGLGDGVVALGRDGRVGYANSAAATILGVDVTTGESSVWEEILANNNWLAVLVDEVAQDARSRLLHEVSLVRRHDTMPVRIRVAPLFTADGELRGVIVVLSDESSLVHMSERQQHEDRLQQLGVLAAGLAHEVKNPLAGILGAAQLIRGDDLSAESAEYVDLIERDVRRINRLIDGLLNFDKPESLSFSPGNPHLILDHVLQSIRLDPLAEGHDLIRDYDPSLPDVPLDADAVHQMVLNLVKNALQASPPGAPVRLRTRADIGGRRSTGRTLLIEVENVGAMPEDIRRKLFTPFFTTRPGGSGLGLSITLSLCRAHWGNLEVVVTGERTIFSIALPMERPAKATPAKANGKE